MNFLKSILSDEQEPPEDKISDANSSVDPPRDENNPNDVDDDGWSFGGMIKTLAMQSETVIEIYRKDLEEFGSGLRKETELLRETASRAVKELPASLEAAHGALLKSTVNIISKESLGFSPDGESGTPGTNRSSSSGRYSRFEAQVSAIQNDLNTYCVEPEDGEDYSKWKLGFELENYSDEIDRLIGGNGILEGVYKRVVPSSVDGETFWCRYFYRVEKLKQQESVRANLVRRAISVDDDELSSWDFDEDEDDDDQNVKGGDGNGDSVANASDGENNHVVESSKKSSDDVSKEENLQTVGEDEKVKSEDNSNDEKVKGEEKGESDGKSDATMVSSHQSKAEEEDLRWDEMEDTGSGGGKEISAVDHGGSPKKDDLRRRLSGGDDDDDDDLNWDIEDDDHDEQPVKG